MQIIAIKAQADPLLELTRAAPAEGAESTGVFAALLASLTAEAPPPTEAATTTAPIVEVEEPVEEPVPEVDAWLPDGIAAVATAAPALTAPPPTMVAAPVANPTPTQAATVAVDESIQASAPTKVVQATPSVTSESTSSPTVVEAAAPPEVEAFHLPTSTQSIEKSELEVVAEKPPTLTLESEANPAPQPKATPEPALAKAETPVNAVAPDSVDSPAKAEAPAKQPVEQPPVAQQAKPQQPSPTAKEIVVVQPAPAPASTKAHQREAVAKQTVERLAAAKQLSAAYTVDESSETQADPLLAKLAEANVSATRDTSQSAPLSLHREANAPAVAPSEDGAVNTGTEVGARPPLLGAVLKDTAAAGALQPSQAAPIEVPVGELARFAERGIKQLLDSGEQRMHIRVTPESLGEMQIEVTRSGGDVQVRLTAATQAVRDLLDANTHHLREALVREGFDTAKIQVAPPSSSGGLNLNFSGAGHDTQQGQQAQQQQQGQPHWNAPRFAGADANRADAPRKPQPAHAGDGLNVMV